MSFLQQETYHLIYFSFFLKDHGESTIFYLFNNSYIDNPAHKHYKLNGLLKYVLHWKIS